MEEFQSALVRAVEDVRGFLAGHRAPAGDRSPQVAAQLGAFGAGRIDPARFASLLTVPETLDAERLHRVEKALSHLEALEVRGDELYRTKVPPGGDLRDTVAHALATVGGAFGMIRVVASARDGRSEPLDPADFTHGFPARRWGRSERKMAPPLVVEVRGEDLVVGGLGEFLEGGLEIVLVVEGKTPPAPLARLIAPGVFVVQTTEAAGLAAAMAFDGPVVAAVMPEGAARFTHDPAAGASYGARLTVHEAADPDALAPVGPLSVFQQAQDLAHLEALVRGGAPAGAAAGPVAAGAAGAEGPLGGESTPADRLAGWLLQQAQLPVD
jgi:hypothetical protein